MMRSIEETKDVSQGASLPADRMPAILSLVGGSAQAVDIMALAASAMPVNAAHTLFICSLLPCCLERCQNRIDDLQVDTVNGTQIGDRIVRYSGDLQHEHIH